MKVMMIEEARNLSRDNRELLLAYLHFLHMQEHFQRARSRDWAYRSIQAHWLRSKYRAHFIGVNHG